MITTRSALAVSKSIYEKNPTIQEFYDYVTQNGTDFAYDVNAQGYLCSTAILHACGTGNLELAQALINMGADINSQMVDGTTPLFYAILNGHFDVVKMLMENGATLNDVFGNKLSDDEFTIQNNFNLFNNPEKKQDLNGYIFLAIKENQQKIADYLIQMNSTRLEDLIVNRLKYDPIFYHECKNVRDFFLHENFINQIEGIDKKERKIEIRYLRHEHYLRKNNIQNAVKENNLQKMESLLNDTESPHIDLKRLAVDCYSLLHATIQHGNLNMLKLLIKHGHNINETATTIDIRNAGQHEMADYIDQLQLSRYQQLQKDATLQTQKIKSKLFIHGMFFDTNSKLHQDLVQHLSNKNAAEVTKTILKNI